MTGNLHTSATRGTPQRPAPLYIETLEDCVDRIIARAGCRLVVGTPLGIGKPNPLLNTLYRRAVAQPALELTLVTALSLGRPVPRNELERRFLEPFNQRHFGNYPELEYLAALRSGELPPNVRVSEFYFVSGQCLGVEAAQRHYVSSNYTHVARDMMDAGLNVILQLVARQQRPEGLRFSLGSNPDLTLDVVDAAQARQQRPFVVAQVSEHLPFMHGDAIVEPSFFDLVLDCPAIDFEPFAVPKAPVSTADYMIGIHASALMRDGGTLQVGIGSLGDAFVYATRLRHEHNATWRELISAAGLSEQAKSLMSKIGGTDPFDEGLYGASEMFMDGFMHLYTSGILKRRVFEDEALHAGGILMHGAFLLGSRDFYTWLEGLSDEEHQGFCMTRVSKVNQLYGDAVLQRRDARFINSAMKMTLLGASVSDGLDNGQIVSGVGGQYNFVSMAHALPGGRSILMFRSTRGHGRSLESNVLWNYGHTTIPRHLRDIAVSEYGAADLRGKTDEQCIVAMLGIADSRFQTTLLRQAKRAGKLAKNYRIPQDCTRNLPARLEKKLAPFRDSGLFGMFPFGSDFSAEEQVLALALKRLAVRTGSPIGKAGAIARALIPGRISPRAMRCLQRMGLAEPAGLRERVLRRLLAAELE